MVWVVFAKGLALGFSIAAPVGPIGLLCIRRTLVQGWKSGVTSGLGAAAADAVYGSLAAFGLSALTLLLLGAQTFLHMAGGLFLLYLGYCAFQARPAPPNAAARTGNTTGSFVSTFLLTITNPMTIMSFAGLFAGLGIGEPSGGYWSSLLLVAGVFTGSMLWWLMLCSTVNALRERLPLHRLTVINKLSGLILIIFGCAALAARFGG